MASEKIEEAIEQYLLGSLEFEQTAEQLELMEQKVTIIRKLAQ